MQRERKRERAGRQREKKRGEVEENGLCIY